MATLTNKRSWFWRADWFGGILFAMVVLFLHGLTNFLGTLECRYYKFASTSPSCHPSDCIAIIATDDQSIAKIGRWPSPRDVQAKLVDQLSAAKAKTIVNTTLFFEPQADRSIITFAAMQSETFAFEKIIAGDSLGTEPKTQA